MISCVISGKLCQTARRRIDHLHTMKQNLGFQGKMCSEKFQLYQIQNDRPLVNVPDIKQSASDSKM